MKIRLLYKDLKIGLSDIQIESSSSDYNYLVNVLKITYNSEVIFFNENLEFLFSVLTINKKYIKLKYNSKIEKNLTNYIKDTTAIVPFLKVDKLILISKQLTEIGIENIIFCNMQNSSLRDFNLKRIELNIKEALEQSNGNKFPVIQITKNLKETLKLIEKDNITLFYGDCINLENKKITKISEKYKKVATICGPEGGFSKDEILIIESYSNTKPVVISNRILRTETAILSLVNFALLSIED